MYKTTKLIEQQMEAQWQQTEALIVAFTDDTGIRTRQPSLPAAAFHSTLLSNSAWTDRFIGIRKVLPCLLSSRKCDFFKITLKFFPT